MAALLDVLEAFDPSFIDLIQVDRISEVVDQYGRAQRYKQRFSNIKAVVTATGPADLQRMTDYELMRKSISVYTPEFKLQGPVQDPQTGLKRTQPDEIIWNHNTYVVSTMMDYSNWGRGFTSAIAISIDAVDAPPLGGSVGTA